MRVYFFFQRERKSTKKNAAFYHIKVYLYVVGYTGCCFCLPPKATPQTADLHHISRRGCPCRVVYYIYCVLRVPAN